MNALRPHLPEDFCHQTAQFILDNPGTTLIATGFYILSAGAAENDGPPGALALGRALQALDRRVVYVTDRYCVPLMRALGGSSAEVVDFPIADDETSRKFASDLLAQLSPSLLIAIERCGLTKDGTYLNMRSMDISPHTARLDHLFLQHSRSVGIGDGGNEIGMGTLARQVQEVPSLPNNPTTTPATHLVVCSVSNWGGYGLVAALSRLVGRNLLPSVDEELALIRHAVDFGAVEGMSGERKYVVDGYSLEENADILSRLHALLAEEGIGSG